MKKVPLSIRKQNFILGFLHEKTYVDVTNQGFHEQWFELFGGRRKETVWGAQPVYDAQFWLRKLLDQGILFRFVVTLGVNWQPGFPRWVYGYGLTKLGKSMTKKNVFARSQPHENS